VRSFGFFLLFVGFAVLLGSTFFFESRAISHASEVHHSLQTKECFSRQEVLDQMIELLQRTQGSKLWFGLSGVALLSGGLILAVTRKATNEKIAD
jgi:hypothetical protein